MSRTVFVNPGFSNPRRRRKKSKRRSRGRRGSYRRRSRGRKQTYRGTITMRRNAGIAPFVQNPLILSNPRKRRRRKNPLAIPSMKGILEGLLSSGGGAAIALTVNTVGTSRISNNWARRAAQAGAAGVGSAVLSQYGGDKLGCAFGGAMMVPLLQDLAADLLGIGIGAGVSAKEADIDALAADLEDVLDEMDPDDAADYGDDDEYAW